VWRGNGALSILRDTAFLVRLRFVKRTPSRGVLGLLDSCTELVSRAVLAKRSVFDSPRPQTLGSISVCVSPRNRLKTLNMAAGELKPKHPPDDDHLWRDRAAFVCSWTLPGILLLLALYSLKIASAFFIPVVFAFLLSFILGPVVRVLAGFHVPIPLGAALVILVLLGILGFGIYQLTVPAKEWVVKLPETIRQMEHKFQSIKESVGHVSKVSKEVDRLTALNDDTKQQEVAIKKETIGETLLAPTQELIIGGFLMVILLFFLLASGDLFLRKLLAVLPSLHDKKVAVDISHQIEQNISTYLFTITVINACFGATVGVCMYFLGLPNAPLWGVMVGLLNFIPFLGSTIAVIILTIVAAVTSDNMATVAFVPVTYLSLNILVEYVILPFVLGHRLFLNPVVVLLWLIFWGWLWGIPGALMAVPLLAIVSIICHNIESFAPIAEFLDH
jgi:predicted PurR-regulated permease PerM